MPKLQFSILTLVLVFLLSGGSSAGQSQKQNAEWKPAEGAELIGTRAPEFAGLTWVNCKPLTITSLKGKPVFVRFWSGGCSFCEQSMPAINYLQKNYAPQGLMVIGIHHPKGEGSPRSAEKVKTVIGDWDMKFPVALDNDWKTLRKFWLGKKREYTSASVLIDKKGIVRWVHPGGVLLLPASSGGDGQSSAFDNLKHTIEQVLKEQT